MTAARRISRAIRLPAALPGPHAATWVLAEAAVAALMSIASMVIIGRILGPEAIGLGMVPVAAFFLLDLLPTTLWTEALVQRPQLSARHANSAVTSAVLTGAACSVALVLAAPYLGNAGPGGAAAEAIVPLAMGLAAVLPVSAFNYSVTGLLLREQRFRLLAGRALLGQPLGLVAGVAAGLAGYGPWALVLQQAVVTGVALVLVLGFGRLRLRPMLDFGVLRDLAPVAGPQYAATVVEVGKYRVLTVVLGALLPAAAMAQAHVGLRVVDGAVAPVAQVITRLALPRLCAVQDDRAALAESFGRLAQLQALLGLPAVVGIAFVAPGLVALLLGPAWAGTADATRVAALGAMALFLVGPFGPLFVARGKTGMNLRIALATVGLQAAALVAMRPASALEVALALAFAANAICPVLAWLVLRELDRTLGWLLVRLAPGLLASAGMAAVLALLQHEWPMPPLPGLLASVGLGGAAYAAAAWAALGFRRPAAMARA